MLVLPGVIGMGWATVWLESPEQLIAGCCFLALIVGSTLLSPKLVCPVCLSNPTDRLNRYCPKCGRESIRDEDRKPGVLPTCSACGGRLWRSKRGSGVELYPICYCTHCGSHLDDEGV